MKRHNLRHLPRVSYSEMEEPSLDEYVFCEKCADFVYEYCSIHGPLLVIPDDKVPASPPSPSVPRAALTIPHVFLHLAPSIIPGAGLGVFSSLTLPSGVSFGPYRGANTHKVNSMYCWQIRDKNNKPSHVVDASNPVTSNWLRYVNCARRWREQNLVAYQYKGQIYYRTIKIIPRFTELMVFYGSEFAAALDIDLRKYNSPAGYAQKYGVPVPKKTKLHEDIKEKETKIQSPPKNNQESDKSSEGKQKCTAEHKNLESKQQPSNVSNDNCDPVKNVQSNNPENYLKENSRPKPHHRSDCGKVLSEKCNLITHTGDKAYICSYCNKAFSHKYNLTTHIRTHTGDKPFECSYCNKAFSDKSYLTTHIRTHTGDKPYKCSHCNKAFSDKSSLTTHIRTHTGDKPFKCSYCNKAFSDKGHLTTHIRTHTGDKPFECSHCNKAFSDKSSLTRHIRTHTGDKPYKCSHCNKAFSQISSLTKHIRTHTGDKPYKCSHCNKAFSQISSLTKHIRTHTGDKPFKCSYCNKAFSDKGHLTRHIRTHTGDKPYKCRHCNKAFSDKDNLTRHIRTHIGDKPYKCSHCNKAFSDKSDLTTHVRTHTGDKPYKCSHCNKAFSVKSNLTRHIRTHTGDKPYI